MAFYKMTRGSISVIRHDAAGVAEAEARGFVLVGVCDKDGNLTGAALPEITEPIHQPISTPPVTAEKKAKGRK